MPILSSRKDPLQNVISATPQAPVAPVEVIKTSNPAVKLTSVDTRWIPRTHLITHIEGASWYVDYFSQVLTEDSELSGQQVSANAAYQSYKRIVGLEMKVTSPLSTVQDDETKAMKVEGGATLYPFLIPNEGDMFVADIGEGKRGVFRITSTVKKSIFQEACYEISYSLNSDELSRIEDLLSKTVDSVYFHKDYLTYGQNPLLIKSDADVLLDLEKQVQLLVRTYCKKFYSREYATFIVPKQGQSVYDHFLNQFIQDTFGAHAEMSTELYSMKLLNVSGDELLRTDSLWKALAVRDVGVMNTLFQRSALVSPQEFVYNPMLESIRWSGFAKLVYPTDPEFSVDADLVTPLTYALEQWPFKPSLAESAPQLPITTPVAKNLRGIFPEGTALTALVTVDDYYVLSEKFYKKMAGMSVLETLTWQYLQGEKQDFTQLLELSKLYHAWGDLEQFYYVPLLVTFIRATIRGH